MVLPIEQRDAALVDLNEPPHSHHDQFAELDAHNYCRLFKRPLRSSTEGGGALIRRALVNPARSSRTSIRASSAPMLPQFFADELGVFFRKPDLGTGKFDDLARPGA